MTHTQEVMEEELLKTLLRHPGHSVVVLEDDLFVTPVGQIGYEAFRKMADADIESALPTFLKAVGEALPALGGFAVASRLYSEPYLPTLAKQLVADLQETKAKRVVTKLGFEMSTLAQAGASAAELSGLNEQLQAALAPPIEAKSKAKPVRDYLQEIIDDAEAASEGKVKPPPSTGLPLLDYHIEGISPSTFMVIAGKTSGGKTALALQLAKEYSIVQELPSIYISYEMPGKMLSRRILSAESRVPLKTIKAGQFSVDETSRVEKSIFKVMHSGLYILDDVQDMSVAAIRSACRSAKASFGIGLVVVDYIQLVPATNPKDSRERQVADISYGLQKMAQELQCCVIGLSQLNDDGLLRESRAIGHDADVVMVIEGDNDDPRRELHLVKVRNGPTGSIPLEFDGETQRFVQRK